MSKNRLLIIFAKNPEKGRVKTRLAKTLGEEKALDIYRSLLDFTLRIAEGCEADKELWYSRFIPEQEKWDKKGFQIKLQQGDDLGERMKNAFRKAFKKGYQKAVIIGSDCAGISEELIDASYAKLEEADMVIGPSTDGGYYLLGLKECYDALFEGISWSTDKVLKQTRDAAEELGIKTALLPERNDVDNEADWQSEKHKF